MSHGLLEQAFVYLAAAVIGVPVAKRLGLGSVLGYLLAGVLIGPFALGLVGQEGGDVMHFAELGVVMMLFLVGLELRPTLLWQLRRSILGLGGAQVLVTAGVLAALALPLGLSWKAALAVGLTLSMSSTAIVLQSLSEKRLLGSTGGQAAFSVLLFQDIAVIPILALLPLLASAPLVAAGPGGGWAQAAQVLVAVAVIVLAGRFVVRPFFRSLAQTRLREVFTAAALFIVVSIALLMQAVGLSPALGTFLAGVVLAESEYRHELEADIEPFKGLLLGLFFIAVGAQIDFSLVASRPGAVSALVAGVVAAKLAVLYALARAFGLDRPARWLFALALAQVGEFAFVLLSFATQTQVLTGGEAAPLVAAVALSMAVTPLLFVLLERVILPRLTARAAQRQADAIAHADNPVVIAGFGRVGQVVGRLLRANGVGATVLDLDPGMVDLLRRLGMSVHYGDASRPELLHAAGCARAKLFVLAVDDTERALTIAKTVRQSYPDLPIIARARNRTHYYELRRLGIEAVFRETFASSLEMGVAALRAIGWRAHTAQRKARLWRQHEETALGELLSLWGHDEREYFAAARRALEEAERLLREESEGAWHERDAAWDDASLRAAAAERARE